MEEEEKDRAVAEATAVTAASPSDQRPIESGNANVIAGPADEAADTAPPRPDSAATTVVERAKPEEPGAGFELEEADGTPLTDELGALKAALAKASERERAATERENAAAAREAKAAARETAAAEREAAAAEREAKAAARETAAAELEAAALSQAGKRKGKGRVHPGHGR